MKIDNEKQLVQLAKCGDKEAFGELMSIYSNNIYGLSLKLSRNSTMAQDLTQETFIKALNNIDKFKEEAKFSTWLYRINTNLWINKYNKQKKNIILPLVASEDDYEPRIASSLFDPAEINRKIEIKEILWKSLDILPDHEKLVIVLCVYEGKKYREIAQICNCSIKTVSSRYSRGIKRLKKYFKDNKENEL